MAPRPQFVFVLALCLYALIPTASAATITITSTADLVNANDGVVSLREAFATASANGTADQIVLGANQVYALSNCATGALKHTEATALTILGNGSTIDQTCNGKRVIDNLTPMQQTKTLTVDGLTLTGAAGAGNGAGIATRGPTTITNSTFTGLNTGATGAILWDGGNGGQSLYSLDNVEITNNGGTALSLGLASLTLMNSSIVNNTSGGVRLTDGTPMTVSNSVISDNGGDGLSTTGNGFTKLQVSNTIVEGNMGIGVQCSYCATLGIDASAIASNSAGGVVIRYHKSNSIENATATITDTTIEDNTGSTRGGGISVDDNAGPNSQPSPKLLIQGSTISGNIVTGSGLRRGGGIYVGSGSLELVDSQVIGNRVGLPASAANEKYGGGIFFHKTDTATAMTDLSLSDSFVVGNESGSRGGGIYAVTRGKVTISGSTLSDNVANSLGGGALYVVGAKTTILRSRMHDNIAAGGGGIEVGTFFDYPGGTLKIEKSTLDSNIATLAAGGAVSVDTEEQVPIVTLSNSTLTSNQAETSGGGLFVGPGGQVTLQFATIAENTAPVGGNIAMNLKLSGALKSRSSIIVNGGSNCALGGGQMTSTGYNFVSDQTCGSGAQDMVSVTSPNLAPLADNGGSTPTRLPAPDSPVGGLVPHGKCRIQGDQRDLDRPQGTDCDAGAVEIVESSVRGARL